MYAYACYILGFIGPYFHGCCTSKVTTQNFHEIRQYLSSGKDDKPFMCLSLVNTIVLQWCHNERWVGGAVRFLVMGTVGEEERPPRGQLWMDQYLFHSITGLSSTKYEQIRNIFGVWPFWLTSFFFFSVKNILAGLWLNCISSVEITLFLLVDILLQHSPLFRLLGFS